MFDIQGFAGSAPPGLTLSRFELAVCCRSGFWPVAEGELSMFLDCSGRVSSVESSGLEKIETAQAVMLSSSFA
ncbi:hypothetical protein Nepgr_025345 [Nepenthes gracilis]|uniref:Uncharacterized protein n=1 Tax=Nepenthes gracilis TaxID=150966 RepID=A0AAD3XZF3_NEPGR|nr:hypothetical protein Nepgr_025345 [Nepenthes gracilis]